MSAESNLAEQASFDVRAQPRSAGSVPACPPVLPPARTGEARDTNQEPAVRHVLALIAEQPVTRAQIDRLEREVLQLPQLDLLPRHYFAPGLYAREMFIPAGTVLTGAVHKTEHLSVFVGDITILTEQGMQRMTGHHTFVSKPGAKRVGYAHADTWCTGFFPTTTTDIAELEHELVEDAHLLLSNRPAVSAGTTSLKGPSR